ncbi:extracellular solute-binding protein [Paenibacillus sp. GD4]|uniref:extracellular solute-binding protein n=1 Tax=Paenibacillus sp. GD4 TaxID=3068890 RepID=UPI002796AD6A|nr:extracellular solute-binding protein [Paenibacillus sp. GD4]MDQ1909105.1 extracellular solute-binding protein [Paenibacillus sp. GD4]
MQKAMSTFVMLTALVGLVPACSGIYEGNSESVNPREQTDPLKPKPYEIRIAVRSALLPYVETANNINETRLVRKLNELTNVTLNFKVYPQNQYNAKLAQMFALNNLPDVIQGGQPYQREMIGAVEAGVFLPLDDLLKEHAPNLLKLVPEEAWDMVRHEGKIYALPAWMSNTGRRATFMRMDLLKQTGLPQPRTVEEYLEVMRAMKKLGVPYPFGGRVNFEYSDIFFHAYNVFPGYWKIENDQVVPNFFDVDNMTKALQMYRTMYEEGLIHPDFALLSGNDYANNIISGNSAIFQANANTLLSFTDRIRLKIPDAELAIVPSPTGPDGKGGNSLVNPVIRGYYVNKNAEDPARIIRFFDWMATEEAQTFFTFGVEGEDYTMKDGVLHYHTPQSEEQLNEERFRTEWLWMVRDFTYVKGLVERSGTGKKLIEATEHVLSKEGRDTVEFLPELNANMKYPDARVGSRAAISKDILKPIVKIIYGDQPVDSWPRVIEEWKKNGGQAILEEANERYRRGEGVIFPLR